MELKPEQLAARGTTEPLHPVYLIAGPETLRVLEALRYLADECAVAVILIGTEMYERQFTAARTRGRLRPNMVKPGPCPAIPSTGC